MIAKVAIPTAQLFTQPDFIPANGFVVFPNPAKDNIKVFFNAGFSAGQSIDVYNMLGQKVMQTEITTANAGSTVTLPVQKLSAGVYVVSLKNADKKYAVKLVVTR